jgi:hypothetical protein
VDAIFGRVAGEAGAQAGFFDPRFLAVDMALLLIGLDYI